MTDETLDERNARLDKEIRARFVRLPKETQDALLEHAKQVTSRFFCRYCDELGDHEPFDCPNKDIYRI